MFNVVKHFIPDQILNRKVKIKSISDFCLSVLSSPNCPYYGISRHMRQPPMWEWRGLHSLKKCFHLQMSWRVYWSPMWNTFLRTRYRCSRFVSNQSLHILGDKVQGCSKRLICWLSEHLIRMCHMENESWSPCRF